MTTEIENTATPADAQAQQASDQVEVISTDATAELNTDDTKQDDADKAKRVTPNWANKRFSELSNQRNEAIERADRESATVQSLREQIARSQQGEQIDPYQGDFHANVRQEAQRLNAEQTFNDTCNKVYATGKAEFNDFDQSVANLQMVGVSRDFLELATTSDAGAKLIDHLGHDLDEAARISALSPVLMARELTKLEFKLAQTTVKPVSKAPAPIKPIGAGGSTDSGLRDDLSTDEWMRRRNKERFG